MCFKKLKLFKLLKTNQNIINAAACHLRTQKLPETDI